MLLWSRSAWDLLQVGSALEEESRGRLEMTGTRTVWPASLVVECLVAKGRAVPARKDKGRMPISRLKGSPHIGLA